MTNSLVSLRLKSYICKKQNDMEATNTHFNQAQLKLLDMLSYVKTPQELHDL